MVLTGSLDLWVLMVEYVAGGILLSIFIWCLILLVTGIMGRMSMRSILVIIITFLGAASVGYIGVLAAVPMFLFFLWYMTEGIIRKVNGM